MFSALIEKYFFINYIPGVKIFGIAHHIFIYLVLITGIFLILFLKYFQFNIFKNKSFQKILFTFLIIIWFLSGVQWFITEINWLKLDINNFLYKNKVQKRNNITNKFIKGYNMPLNWHNYYIFLKRTKNALPKKSQVFVLPDNPVFVYWARYYFTPDLNLVHSEKKADFIIGFNIAFKNQKGYKVFKKFEDKKLILEKIK